VLQKSFQKPHPPILRYPVKKKLRGKKKEKRNEAAKPCCLLYRFHCIFGAVQRKVRGENVEKPGRVTEGNWGKSAAAVAEADRGGIIMGAGLNVIRARLIEWAIIKREMGLRNAEQCMADSKTNSESLSWGHKSIGIWPNMQFK